MKNKYSKAMAFVMCTVLSVSSIGLSIEKSRPITVSAAENVLAFPGATGVGKYASGGRGGEVVHVTNLNDNGAASLRDAVSKPNRIVVFDVSGTIELASHITIADNVTVAGQTAPGGAGVTVKNYKLALAGNNIICRYISSRPGPYKSTSSGDDAWGGAKGSHSIIDHCSMSFASDEQWGLYSANKYTTVQYSIIGPADSWGGHKKGVHGFGIMMPGTSTFDHNLILHNVSRNFRGKIGGTETCDFTNNVIYNWGYQTAYGTIGHLNYVNNTLKIGPNTKGGFHYIDIDSSTNPQNFSVYASGNQFLNIDNSNYSSLTQNNWDGINVKSSLGITKDSVKSDTAFPTYGSQEDLSSVKNCESAELSYEHVISYAGNGISSDSRTDIDKQCAYETMTGTGTISGTAEYSDADTAQKANIDKYGIACGVKYEYPKAVLKKTITDADNDGMADDWELARGLNPNDPTDTNGDYCGQGYTNIEYYINDLTVNSFPEGVVTLSPELNTKVISAFETIEAEEFDVQQGIKTEECPDGGQNVGYIENDDYIMFRNVDFEDGANSVNVRASSSKSGGKIELYLDKLSDTPFASLCITNTGSWKEYKDFSFNIPKIEGKHNIYLKFTGDEGYLMNINHFVFAKSSVKLSGELIQQLSVMDNENISEWLIGQNLTIGSLVYGDRTVTFSDIPSELIGSEQIMTACDSKNSSLEQLAEFTAGDDITVYVAIDSRVTSLPNWLKEWKNSEYKLYSSNDVSFKLYQKNFDMGDKVVLGTNGQTTGCVNYSVIASKISGKPVKGDVNNDGVFTVADVVLLQKWLLAVPDVELYNWKAGDFYEDGRLDVFDLCLMKREFLEK